MTRSGSGSQSVRIDWSEPAFDDLSALRDYIARDAPHYAEQFIDRLMDAAGRLAEFPDIGRRVPEADGASGLREIIFHSYRLIYQVDRTADRILIVTLVHGSRDIAGQDPKPWDIV